MGAEWSLGGTVKRILGSGYGWKPRTPFLLGEFLATVHEPNDEADQRDEGHDVYGRSVSRSGNFRKAKVYSGQLSRSSCTCEEPLSSFTTDSLQSGQPSMCFAAWPLAHTKAKDNVRGAEPCFSMRSASTRSAIASVRANASSRVLPYDMTPGSSGISAIERPSSSRSNSTVKFI
jgi:hypothetical protein